MEDMGRVQIPAFGNWDYCDQMPITQYFESAMQAGLIRAGHCYAAAAPAAAHGYGGGGDDDLFKVPVATAVARPVHHHRKVMKSGGGVGGEKRVSREQQLRKQGKVYDLTNQSPRKNNINIVKPKAVDEDLYKIPPELLYQKPKKKRLLRNLWSGCLGLNCIA